MTFERPSNWFGRDYTQTLEPRLFYLNIPYENQDDIPIFDTGSGRLQLRADLCRQPVFRLGSHQQRQSVDRRPEFSPDRSVERWRDHARQ
jgi:hypothetical protein